MEPAPVMPRVHKRFFLLRFRSYSLAAGFVLFKSARRAANPRRLFLISYGRRNRPLIPLFMMRFPYKVVTPFILHIYE